jgi:DNA-binding response OmpR family regulator/two-component sensor histidine kinase
VHKTNEGKSNTSNRGKQADFDAEQLKELSRLRTTFYTNITHEFRTPLTVITGMAGMIEENPEHAEEAVAMIKRNSANLLTLINQMLDLSKLDSGAMTLKKIRGDVIAHINYIVESLHSFAEIHDVELQFHHENNVFEMDYDPEKLMHVLSNLIANGIKFTPKGGYVEVWMRWTNASGVEEFHVSVRDSGIGIGVEHLPYIFDRFYRVEDTAIKTSKGTGIGLALTKDLVELMGGVIDVQSATGKGATFIVTLPVTREAEQDTYELTVDEVRAASASYVTGHLSVMPKNQRYPENDPLPVVLVVEDNPDVARYVAACLSQKYNVDFAGDGKAGIERAIETVPDLIVTDVMMPVKDGFELCASLKKDQRTSHIPIIMLTAKADMESRIEGLEQGADAYLSKPFNKDELLVRLRKLLELRKILQQRYMSGDEIDTSTSDSPQIEDAFITKLIETIHAHIDDSEFGIMQTARVMTLSRAQLHNKIKALTGRSTGLYIRYIRLLQAHKLLDNPDLNISEIAYDVGFKDPAYFTRCFKEEFGKAPSEFR